MCFQSAHGNNNSRYQTTPFGGTRYFRLRSIHFLRLVCRLNSELLTAFLPSMTPPTYQKSNRNSRLIEMALDSPPHRNDCLLNSKIPLQWHLCTRHSHHTDTNCARNTPTTQIPLVHETLPPHRNATGSAAPIHCMLPHVCWSAFHIGGILCAGSAYQGFYANQSSPHGTRKFL